MQKQFAITQLLLRFVLLRTIAVQILIVLVQVKRKIYRGEKKID